VWGIAQGGSIVRNLFIYIASAYFVAGPMAANAALIDRGEGFIYDDVLNITWTQNANINGLADWNAQVAWADGYSQTHSVFGTFDDWRLPNMDVDGDQDIIQCESLLSSEIDCRDNEFGYLFYEYGITLAAPGVFTDIQLNNYWSGTVKASDPFTAFTFRYSDGQTGGDLKNVEYGSWAARDGDIVPIPAAVWLFASGLGLLGWIKRRA
jgi:hypothetical protein